MTRQEFFERRARMHFVKTHGITQCPSAGHQAWPQVTHGRSHGQHHLTMLNLAQRMAGYPRDGHGPIERAMPRRPLVPTPGVPRRNRT